VIWLAHCVVDAALLLAMVGALQCCLGLLAVRRFALGDAATPSLPPGRAPPVTVLRPLCGDEPLLEQALLSCFTQDYPHFQILFGVQNAGDAALPIVERLRRRFPAIETDLVIDATLHGPNRKVSNLINMMTAARHAILVICDSDLHLPSNYLERLVAQLEKPGTGLVTALYIGVPPKPGSWPEALGATQISHGFLPGVLLSRWMGRQDCLGSTTMLRRQILERTGGFAPLSRVLAEDNLLGQRVRDLGLSVALADVVASATVPEPNLALLWQHEIRWARTIRELAPSSLLASILQYPLFWSAVAVIVSGAALPALLLFFACWAIRLACARGIDQTLRPRAGRAPIATPFWLFPLRDILSVCEILACFWVNQVTWRGHRMAADGAATAPVAESQKLRRGDAG
jgi:ceramide glucosyltransferase